MRLRICARIHDGDSASRNLQYYFTWDACSVIYAVRYTIPYNWQDDRWIRCRDLIEITASIRSFFFFCPSSPSSASPPGFCPFAFRGSVSKSDHGCSLLIVAMAWQWAHTRSSVPLVYYNYSHSIMQYTAIRNPGQDLKRKYTNRSCNYTLAVA